MFGLTDDGWSAAESELRAALLGAAYERRFTWYGEVASQVVTVQLVPYSDLMTHLLGDVFFKECQAGRPALPAIVMREPGDQLPGRGFYRLAQALGYQAGGPYEYWLSQVRAVFKLHGQPGGPRWRQFDH